MTLSMKGVGKRLGLLAALVGALVIACTGVVLAQGSAANSGFGEASPATPGDKDQTSPAANGSSVTTDVSAAANVTNGNFETGNFTGWNRVNKEGGSGSWFVYSTNTSPLSNNPIAVPPQGNFAATSDQNNPGTQVLIKTIKLQSGMRHELSFILYYRNFNAGGFFTPNTLNFKAAPNQQYRIDVLKSNANPFSVNPNDILKPLFRTNVGAPNTRSPQVRSFNLTPFAGKTVHLRFAAVETEDFLLASVDRVKVESTSKN
jgi:hypothetical protein